MTKKEYKIVKKEINNLVVEKALILKELVGQG